MNKDFIKNLRQIQKIGYVFSVLIGLIILIQQGWFGIFLALLVFVFLCIANYLSTQFFISVIDLLMKIEENTRKD